MTEVIPHFQTDPYDCLVVPNWAYGVSIMTMVIKGYPRYDMI